VLTDYVVAMPHPDPHASCHVVVAPRRHVATFYDLDVQEQRMLWDLVGEIRKRIALSLKVDGFDVGFSDASPEDEGAAHAHIHVLPRIPGEVIELPPGVQWVDVNSQ
jgi:diadenosine tetraphosphate (Ap4A) HIT family hydrolase